MKNKINIKSLVFGAVLGAVVVSSVGAATDRSDENLQTKALDYKVLQCYNSDIEKKLKLAGDEGWVVASSTSPDGLGGLVLVILKRDK